MAHSKANRKEENGDIVFMISAGDFKAGSRASALSRSLQLSSLKPAMGAHSPMPVWAPSSLSIRI
jgi:hypothetical protein